MENKKYVRVMDGLKSNANGQEFKLDEVITADVWNPSKQDPEEMGGFNFTTKDKILRYIFRGDTIYDVIVPDDAEMVVLDSKNAPKSICRANKIIVTNPKPVTDEMAMDFYKKSILPEKSYFKAMAGCAIRGYINTAIQIFRDKVNKENVNLAFEEFKNFVTPNDKEEFSEEYLGEYTKKIYDMFIELINM